VEYYLLIVIALMLLAAIDLTVGVANDAVNFLNSAVGSKAAPLKVILIFAALGVLAGVIFSSGMMEVARKGIFNPQYFYMPELMLIFLATMIAEILLLDMFNTFGMPTSTTVSIVFGLAGSALAFSVLKIIDNQESFDMIFTYLNTPNLVKIIGAILLSIVMAFIVGSIIQFITRLLFTFQYKKRFARYGAIWAGLALTSLSLFIILKGTKGATFMTEEMSSFIKNNLLLISLYCFVGWTILLQLIMWFTKINVLKIIVLIGTFALAMAFSANDLVNFIGAPLAGLNTYQEAQTMNAPFTTLMVDFATKKVVANTWILLTAGLIMVLALVFSKKSRTVTQTTIRLSRQEEGFERFESNIVARVIVRLSLNIGKFIMSIIPRYFRQKLRTRFDVSKYEPELDKDGEAPAFDLLRAAVILMVASMLISLGTYFKLPLSTTYVTFIVAMACALPDKAWGRESAVYRISGVITVIGGWFFTAFSATAVAFVIALILYYGEIFGIIGMLGLVAFTLIRTRTMHKNREDSDKESSDEEPEEEYDTAKLLDAFTKRTAKFVSLTAQSLKSGINGLLNSDLKELKEARKYAGKLDKQLNKMFKKVLNIAQSEEDDIDSASQYISRIISFLYIANEKIKSVTLQTYKYVDNNHHELASIQAEEMKEVLIDFEYVTNELSIYLQEHKFKKIDALLLITKDLNDKIRKFNKSELKRIKKIKTKTRLSVLYLNLLSDIEELNDTFIKLGKYISNMGEISSRPEENEPK